MRVNRILFCFLTLLLLLSACGRNNGTDAAALPSSEFFIDELIFLGDSTTAHMQQRAAVRPEQVLTTKERWLNLDPRITHARIIAPDTGEEQPIAEVVARLKPAYLVITLGVDYGVYYYRDRPETFRFYYEKLLSQLEAASPDTGLVLQSIFPVSRDCKAITNEMIQRANTTVAEIARDRGLVFVDQTPVLCDGEGYLRPEYCASADGIHLTAKAYEAILSHLNEMESEIKGS